MTRHHVQQRATWCSRVHVHSARARLREVIPFDLSAVSRDSTAGGIYLAKATARS